jgi:hypothetical protein
MKLARPILALTTSLSAVMVVLVKYRIIKCKNKRRLTFIHDTLDMLLHAWYRIIMHKPVSRYHRIMHMLHHIV